MDGLLKKALSATRESKFIEFKESFDVASSGDWCEIIKDIIALANTGGGMILIGVDNHGKPNGFDIRQVMGCDTADITNKIHKYTGWQFSEFEISEEDKDKAKAGCCGAIGTLSNQCGESCRARFETFKGDWNKHANRTCRALLARRAFLTGRNQIRSIR